MQKYLLAMGLVATPLTPAFAQDFFVYGGGELEFLSQPNGAGNGNVSSAFAYLELEKAGAYAGVSGKVESDSVANEVDLYLGYRAETAAGLGYDIGYSRYFYPKDGGDCCGEVTLSLGMPFGDKFKGTFDAAYDPQASLGNAYVGVEYFANDKITVSANYGTYQVEGAGREQEWDFGVGYALGEETSVDLRYYDGTEYVESYIGLKLTWDTTILSR